MSVTTSRTQQSGARAGPFPPGGNTLSHQGGRGGITPQFHIAQSVSHRPIPAFVDDMTEMLVKDCVDDIKIVEQQMKYQPEQINQLAERYAKQQVLIQQLTEQVQQLQLRPLQR